MRIRTSWLRVVLGLCLLSPGAVNAEVRRSAEKELQLILKGSTVERHISGAEHRVAVFTYEDPNGTGLGDALAGLIARRVLTESRVGSIGVIRYEGNLTPSSPGELGYFDKVDLIARGQDVSLSAWGIIRLLAGQLEVETFVQIPVRPLEEHFRWLLRLPDSMGSAQLTARLRPDRIAAQKLSLPASAANSIRRAAAPVDEVRASPRVDAEIVATLPQEAVYRVLDQSGDWIQVTTGTLTGWVAAGGRCEGSCQQLTEAADFASQLLRYMAGTGMPEPAPSLAADVGSIADQIRALDGLSATSAQEIWERSMSTARERILEDGDAGGPSPAAGAVFYNIAMLADISIRLHERFEEMSFDRPDLEAKELFDELILDREWIASLAFRLAEASLRDPRNPDVLSNLSVLFSYAGDPDRSALAAQLADKASK